MKHFFKTFAALALLLSVACLFYLPFVFDKPGYDGDSIKFQAIGPVLGVPHPTGYPVYMTILWAVSHLPVSTMAFKTNMASCVFAILAIALLYLRLAVEAKNRTVALALALLFISMPSAWQYACVAEVYAFHWLLLAAFFSVLFGWLDEPSSSGFGWFMAIFLISLLHHLLTATLAPGLMIALWANRRRVPPIRFTAFVFTLCLMVYGLVHIAWFGWIQSAPVYLDGQIEGVTGYISHAFGGGYREVAVADESLASGAWKALGFAGMLADAWGWPLVLAYLALLIEASWAALERNAIKEKTLIVSIVAWHALCSVYDISDIDQYFPHGAMLILLLAAVRFSRWRERIRLKNKLRFAMYASLALGVIALLWIRWQSPPNELLRYRASQPQYFRNLLELAPDASIIDGGSYPYEQLLNYYRIEAKRHETIPLLLFLPSAQIFNYMVYSSPINARGISVEAGLPAYAFIDRAAYLRLGLHAEPVEIPAGSILKRNFVDHINIAGSRKTILIAGSPSLDPQEIPQWLDSLGSIGIELNQEQFTRECFAAVIDGDGKLTRLENGNSVEIQLHTHDASIQCEIDDGGVSSFIEVNGVRYQENLRGLSVAIVDSWGRVEEAFTVDPMYNRRVFQFDLYEISAP